MRKNALPFVMSASIALLAASPLAAQQTKQQGRSARVPATIVLADSFPYPGTNAVIIRRRGDATDRARPDIIVLRGSTATTQELSDAIVNLLSVRGGLGDTASSSRILRVHPHPGVSEAKPKAVLPWAQRVLADLRIAPERQIAGVGRVRAVDIWLTPQRGRHTAQWRVVKKP